MNKNGEFEKQKELWKRDRKVANITEVIVSLYVAIAILATMVGNYNGTMSNLCIIAFYASFAFIAWVHYLVETNLMCWRMFSTFTSVVVLVVELCLYCLIFSPFIGLLRAYKASVAAIKEVIGLECYRWNKHSV